MLLNNQNYYNNMAILYLKNTGKTDPGVLISIANQIKRAINYEWNRENKGKLDRPSVSTDTRSGSITISNIAESASSTMRGLIERSVKNFKVKKGRVPRFNITTLDDENNS